MDGLSEHTAEKCPDCGHAPGERPMSEGFKESEGVKAFYGEVGECDDSGCDKIANPFLTAKEDSVNSWTNPYVNPYGGIYMTSSAGYAEDNTSCSFPKSAKFCGSVSDEKYAQSKQKYAQVQDDFKMGEGCAPPCFTGNEPKMMSSKRVRRGNMSQNPIGYCQAESNMRQEDEMTQEAKRWMTKYSDLKKKTEMEKEFIADYLEEVTSELHRGFEEISEKLLQVVYEKISELERKIESKNG